MRINVVLFFLLAFQLHACRKKELQDGIKAEDLYTAPSDPCNNQVMDENELGLDCGGSCAPCNQISVPCSHPMNEVSLENGSLTYTITFWTVQSYYNVDSDLIYEYRAHINADKSLVIYFLGKPNLSTEYYSGAPDADSLMLDKCCVRYENSATNAKIANNGQRFYVTYVDDNYVFTGCDMEFYSEGNVTSITTEFDFALQVF